MIESIRWLSFLTLCIIIPSLIANRDFQLYRTICISKFDIELSQQNEQNILNKLTKELPIFLKERKIYIVSVSDPSNQSLNTTSCDIYLNFTIALDPIYQIENSTSQSLLTYKESINLCPHRELFSFTPILHLPTSWLTDISDSYSDNNQLLTFFRNTLCSGAPNSITGPNFIPTNSTKSSSTSNTADLQLTVLEVGVSFILRQRYERSLWREVFTPSELLALDHIGLFDYRQFVPGGVVIWIGSESKLDLIRSQIISIQYKDTTVIPWAATELIYPCRKGSTQCHGNNNKYKFIPKSDVNHMPPGWGCAQRRPLRALSHILALYDPLYVVILDDDTLFNFPLFLDKYSSFLRNEMLHAPIVLGEFVGKIGNNGHLSKIGMMAGGSGYILGKAVLDRLVAAELIESITSVSQEQYDQRFHFDSSTTSSSNSSRSNSYSDINGQIETLAISSAVEGWNDIYRSVDHINYLSIAKEFKKLSSLSSPYMNMTNTRHSHTRIGFTYTTGNKVSSYSYACIYT